MTDDVRQRMVRGALELLAKRGLEGTSFSEVLELTRAPRGSLYHHFPGGKDELISAALEVAGANALTALEQSKGAPAGEVTRGFLAAWRLLLTRSELSAGCAVLAVTVASSSPALLEQAASIFRSWRASLGELLEAGGVPRADAKRLALLLIASVEGAVVLSRAERSLEPFESVAADLEKAVRAACAPSRKRRRRPSLG